MKVKGIELFKMIKSGEIKNDTRIKVIYGNYNPIYIFRNYCLYDQNNKEMGVSVLLSEKDFEILEDKKEEIEELDTLFCMSDFTDIKYCKGEIDFNGEPGQINFANDDILSYNDETNEFTFTSDGSKSKSRVCVGVIEVGGKRIYIGSSFPSDARTNDILIKI